MNIAIDYDDTYTADPGLWDQFIASARERGHKVWIVTCRRDTPENREEVQVPGCRVFFTNLGSKLDFVKVKRAGMKIDIWIDDDPRCIWEGK